MYFFGAIFIATTVFILIFKKEKSNKVVVGKDRDSKEDANANLNMMKTYKVLFSLFKIRSIRWLAIVLLTVKIGIATENVTSIKLIGRQTILMF